jgi:HAE1 family hydrophobic/amphiphilic exporter-1
MQQLPAALENGSQILLTGSTAGTGNRLDAAPIDSGDNTGRFSVVLKPENSDREEMVKADLRRSLNQIPGLNYEFGQPELVSFSTPLEIEISGYDLGKLSLASNIVIKAMNELGVFRDISSSIELGQPEIQIISDPEKAAQLGLSERAIADSVVDKIRGNIATRYSWRDRKIDVLIRSLDSRNTSIEEVSQLIINPESDRPVTLASVAEIRENIGPASIHRIDQSRVALITANVSDIDIGKAVDILDETLKELSLPTGVSAVVKGQSEEMESAFASMQFALLLAIFLVYLVMASQFESLIHPFVILFTIPLALIGAILALYVTNTTINVVALIGLIMLAGIVVNNGIVLIDLINQLRADGISRAQAILQGGKDRLRPILMTAMTTILGLLPMAIGVGEGSEIRAPMAITVIGGMLVATFLTLIVIPVMYSLLDRKHYV